MAKADLHVHSLYSERPSNWFLQRIGASESYTDPDFIFNTAVSRGMDFVTVTDHNRMDASVYLKEKYPDRVLTGVETTAYFPEDRCKIHVLLYGMDERQFAEVQKIRTDIYQLRDFIRENRIAHSIAHATYSINGKISVDKLEKLILLFDVFEGINGGRSSINNSVWADVLMSLTPSHIEDMYSKHRIEPFGKYPWKKSLTGGSDDHAGLFIAKAFTSADASTPDEFLESLRNRRTSAHGNHNDYKSLAFTIYKIAYDFTMKGSSPARFSSLAMLGDAVLERRISERYTDGFSRNDNPENDENAQIRLLVSALADDLAARDAESDTDIWLERVYDRITSVSDGFFRNILLSMINDSKKGHFDNFIKNISSMLPGIFLSAPFFMTFRHMNDSRELVENLKKKYLDSGSESRGKKILWFTDTFHELNGVASTLREIARISSEKGGNINIVTAISRKNSEKPDNCSQDSIHRDTPPENVLKDILPDNPGSMIQDSLHDTIPDTVVDLSYFLDFRLPYYENIEVRIPSLLACIKKIGSMDVDEIIISTPGPVGLIGLVISRLMNVRCSGIYHTDFAAQAVEITGNESLAGAIEGFIRFFYSFMDEILVPTHEYMDILSRRGFDRSRMKLFLRAIDTDMFSPSAMTGITSGYPEVLKKTSISAGCVSGKKMAGKTKILLYAGRISNDKGIDMIVDIHQRLHESDDRIHLLVVGDGPYLSEIMERTSDKKGITFTGGLRREELPAIYSACDLFVFPSVTDTFGMVVLEAHACGLPAFVSNIGGPKEIVVDGSTGRVLPAGRTTLWVRAVRDYFRIMDTEPERQASMKAAARKRALEFSWESAFGNILDEKKSPERQFPDDDPEYSGDIMSVDFIRHDTGAKPAA